MKLLDAIILTFVFAFNTLLIGVDWQFVAIAVVGSLSGSIVLAYFRRDTRRMEQGLKTLCSSISAVVIGSAIHEYMGVVSLKYDLLLFFCCGLLSLVLLRSLLVVTEKDGLEVLRSVLQRALNLQTSGERNRRGSRADNGRLEINQKENKNGKYN
jgi:MFS family permease